WVQREVANLHQPLVTCEAVLSEVFFLVSRVRQGPSTLISLLRDRLISTAVDFSYDTESAEILRHLERYSNVPMSFADACLVRMCEIDRDAIVFTTDRDFLTYRRNRRQPIPLISPF